MAGLPSVYQDGTTSVTTGTKAVIGQGTLFTKSLLPGDFYGAHKGFAIMIASIEDDTHLTLADNYPGPTQAAAAYKVMLQSDMGRMTESLRQLLVKLSSGNVDALAGLVGAANKFPFFNGAGTMDVGDVSPFARSNVLNKTDRTGLLGGIGAVEQGGGTGQGSNKINIGYSTALLSPRIQVDSSDFGRLWTDLSASNVLAANGYQKFPNGLMIQWGQIGSGGANDAAAPFNLAFAAVPYSLVATAVGEPGAESIAWTVQFSQIGTSNFVYRRRLLVNGGAVSGANYIVVYWIAIGRWF